jgi:phenylpropionate dioxygenase-like ring-hydroxylating dioxygenase large terminal subunit
MSSLFTAREVEGTLKPRKDATWLTQKAYVDKEVFKAERREIFDKGWLALFHETTLPNVGDYRTMDVAGRPLLFVRNRKRELHTYVNVCRHRGMAIAQGQGNCSGFVCPYHTWAYDLDCKVVKRPLYEGNVPLNSDTRLTELRTEIVHGYVFINFDKNPRSVVDTYPDVVADLQPWGDADLEIMSERIYHCKWNWKLMWENSMEGYHVFGIHRDSIEDQTPTNLFHIWAKDPANYTVADAPYSPNRTLEPLDDAIALPKVANIPDWPKKHWRYYILWPMSGFATFEEGLYMYNMIPGDRIDECQAIVSFAVRKEAKKLAGYEKVKEQWDKFFDLIQFEDEYCCSRVQRTYEGCEEWKPGPYAPGEASCWYFHQYYLEKLGVSKAAQFLEKTAERQIHAPKEAAQFLEMTAERRIHAPKIA